MTIEFAPELQREVERLEALMTTPDLFSLFGLPGGAPPEQVKASFFKLCTRIHPDRHFRKNLGEWKPRLDRVFHYLLKAHQTLTDPARREAWLAANPVFAKPRARGRQMMVSLADLGLPGTGKK
ncbi:MAG: DnaJ domain-containing protein [Myxococcaceae bacterium]